MSKTAFPVGRDGRKSPTAQQRSDKDADIFIQIEIDEQAGH